MVIFRLVLLIYWGGYDNITPDLWLTSRERYDPEYFKGKTFLILSEYEWNKFFSYGEETIDDVQEILKYKDFSILVFDYNISQNFKGSR